MNGEKAKVVIVPCSGIGKPFGTVAREAAYEVCDSLRPDATRLVALSKLVLGDDEARNSVAQSPVITIDGCPKMCASKMVRQSGGTLIRETTVFDAFRRHRELKPDGIAELNDQGLQLAKLMALEIAGVVDEHGRSGKVEGGHHG